MKLKDIGLALIIILLWGSNFTVMKFGLDEMPPFFFVALRFLIVAFPLVFFIKPPKTSWLNVFGIGLFMSALQFGLLFAAMRADISSGLASILLQSQVPFTILLSYILLGEKVSKYQILGIVIAVIGFGIFAVFSGSNITLYGLILTLLAGLSWGFGNTIVRRLPPVDPLGVVVWAGLVPIVPMFIFSYFFESSDPIGIFSAMTFKGWGSVFFVAILSSLLGYTLWTSLLNRYPASTVTPFALLIPIVGTITGVIVLGEELTAYETLGFLVVLSGLLITMLGARLARKIQKLRA